MNYGFYLLLMALIATVYSKHTHERESDGAFSPRRTHGENSDDHSFDHESILGTSKEAEEFQDLSPTEAKRRLEILLKRMDRNSDGGIQRRELHQWILRSFASLSKEESDLRFEDSDSDKSGFVTWDEYVREEFDKEPEELEDGLKVVDNEEDAEIQSMLSEDRVLFQAADVNNDGRLDVDEYLAFTHPEEDPKMKPHVIAQTLNDKDKDKDGQISFAEYLGERAKDYDKDRLRDEKDRFDQDLDKNADGYLNEEEIAEWIIPSNEEIADEEADHLFAGADDDQDNVLSFEEILNHHDLFVGSEATDYGEHLKNIHKFQDEL